PVGRDHLLDGEADGAPLRHDQFEPVADGGGVPVPEYFEVGGSEGILRHQPAPGWGEWVLMAVRAGAGHNQSAQGCSAPWDGDPRGAMTYLVQRDAASKPRLLLPRLACDCHAHIFGPPDR